MTQAIKLREQAAASATEARAELDKITDKMSEGEVKEAEARFDKHMEDHDAAIKRAEREEKLAEAEARASKGSHGAQDLGGSEARGQEESQAMEYREAFHEMLQAGGAIGEVSAEARKVLQAGASEIRAQNVGTGSAGGFTVPVELQNILIETMKMHGPMYDGALVTELNTSSGNKIEMPTIDDTSNTGAARAENAALVDDGSGDAVFGKKELDAFVYATPVIKTSMELLQDSIFNVEALLGQLIGKRLGRLANQLLTTGTGSGQPNGIVTAAGAGITAAGAAAITADELIDLYHSVDPAYRSTGGASYMMNDQTLAAIRKLKDGQGNYLWQMGNVKAGVPQTLNNVPIVINQAMPGIATGNRSVLFGDFKQYYVRKVGAPVTGVLREKYFPDVGIVGLTRFDGELADNGAVKALTQA